MLSNIGIVERSYPGLRDMIAKGGSDSKPDKSEIEQCVLDMLIALQRGRHKYAGEHWHCRAKLNQH